MPEHPSIRIYNTMSRRKEPLRMRSAGQVSMYVCGPTVYNLIHIGNARTFLSFDMIRRYLEYRELRVDFVQNLTDVDDKIINKANEEGVEPLEVSERYTAAFREDMDALGVEPATHAPKATEFVGRMVDMIQVLIDKDHAYFSGGDVFYSVGSHSGYGKLSGRNLDDMRAGERVEVDERKRHPMDFVLWKASKPGEPSWESPWGPGRPGWHIECSVMSLHHLGESFDIHGGAQDLIFPHHENEIAQSEGALGEGAFAQQWMHAGLLRVNKEKMSKSLGNFALLRDLLKLWKPQELRLLMLSTHYRQSLEFSDKGLAEARESFGRIRNLFAEAERLQASGDGAATQATESERADFRSYVDTLEPQFVAAMDDDFNTAQALAVIFTAVRRINSFIAAGAGPEVEEAMAVLRLLLAVLGVDVPRDLSAAAKLTAAATLTAKGSADADVVAETDADAISRAELVKLADGMGIPTSGGIVTLIEALTDARAQARMDKDFARSDAIRDGFAAAGILIEDTATGVRWRLADD